MKRYDTHRNFPPPRRPRDSTPAPPEEDELERLLTTSQAPPSEAPAPASTEADPKSEVEPSPPAPSSVASAVTAYVESLPASDPEPRLEESEIDVDAEAARRATDVAGDAASPVSAPASTARTSAIDVDEAPRSGKPKPSLVVVPETSDEDEEEDDDEQEPVSAPKSRRSEPAPVDSVAAIAHSTAPAAKAKRGVTPWIAVFVLGGIVVAFWSLTRAHEMPGRAATQPAAAVLVSPARPEPALPAENQPPSPSASVSPRSATSGE